MYFFFFLMTNCYRAEIGLIYLSFVGDVMEETDGLSWPGIVQWGREKTNWVTVLTVHCVCVYDGSLLKSSVWMERT